MAERNHRTRRLKALGDGLKAMFRDLSARPVPDRIASIVDQLDGQENGEPAEPRQASRLN